MEHTEVVDQIRVLIADDLAFFRREMHALLNATPDMQLVGEAATGKEVVKLAADLQPDIILMDSKMSEMNGIEAIRSIHLTNPHIGILIISLCDEDENVFRVMRAGARGYLLKGANRTEIRQAIRLVNGGHSIFSPTIANRLISFFSLIQPKAPSSIFPELTEREKEVLVLVAQRQKTSEIAVRLSLQTKTVYNYISTIISKLQVADRTEAILRAKEEGLV